MPDRIVMYGTQAAWHLLYVKLDATASMRAAQFRVGPLKADGAQIKDHECQMPWQVSPAQCRIYQWLQASARL